MMMNHDPAICRQYFYCSQRRQRIRFLATGMSYNDLSFSFGIAISTICAAVKEVMDILWNQLYPIHMPVPTKTQLLENSEDFFIKWDFPHCLGAIDCKHIRIKQPARSGSLYFNYKKFYSVVLQAVVDSKYKFISIDVGGFGSQHDAVTLRASSFYKAVQNGLVKLPEADELPNSKIILPYFFIGDGAYPLMESLLKPYPGNKLSKDELIFNKRLSWARMAVECTFGQICQRWKIFYTTIQQEPKIVNIITKCACILHNVIIDMEGENSSNIIDEILDTNTSEEIDHTEDTNFTAGCGKELRDEIKIFVNQNPTSANKNIIKN